MQLLSSKKNISEAIKVVRLNRDFFYLGTLFIVGLAAYFQTLKMYFWLDDYTYLYYAIFSEPQSIFQFPYQFGLILVKLLFSLFGLTAYWYYLLAIVLYLTAVALVYFLATKIFEKKLLAFFTTSIFASGYIGQESLFMVIGDGLYALLGLDVLLISLITLLIYLKNKKAHFLAYSLFCFAACLEIAPTRFAGLVIVLIAAIFLFGKNKLFDKLKLITYFCLIFYLQYVVHPTRYLFHYGSTNSVSAPNNFLQQLTSYHIGDLVNIFGSFGNLFVPTYFRDSRTYSLINAVPIFIFGLIMLVLFKTLRPKTFNIRKFWFCLMLLLGSTAGFFLLTTKLQSPIYKFSIFNGLMILTILIGSLILDLPKKRKMGLFLLITVFSLLGIFSLAKPTIVINSDYRYLLTLAFVPSLLAYILTPKELIDVKVKNKKIAWVIFLSPVLLLSVLHLYLAISTQAKFVDQYTNFRQKYFQELKDYIPSIKNKTIIYTEGSTSQMNYVLGDIERVGTLTSEASYAVNYKTKISNIVLPSDTSDILKLIKSGQVNQSQVFTLIFDGNKLINTSGISRVIFQNPNDEIVLSPIWQTEPKDSLVESIGTLVTARTHFFSNPTGTLGVYPKIYFINRNQISSQLPIKLSFSMKASLTNTLPLPYYHLHYSKDLVKSGLWGEALDWRKSQCQKGLSQQIFECIMDRSMFNKLRGSSGKVIVNWQYDSFGQLSKSKQSEFSVPLDGVSHQYSLVIPAGGQYLKQVSVDYISYPGDLSVELSKMSYVD